MLGVLGLVALFALATAALAEDAKVATVAGEVAQVNATSLVVRIGDDPSAAKEMTFEVDAKTKVSVGKQPMPIGGVHEGDRVTVTYRSDAPDRHTATAIVVTPKS